MYVLALLMCATEIQTHRAYLLNGRTKGHQLELVELQLKKLLVTHIKHALQNVQLNSLFKSPHESYLQSTARPTQVEK